MKVYAESLREYKGLPVARQIMVFGSKWTSGVDAFQRAYQTDPVLVFASRLEASVHGKVQQVCVLFFYCWLILSLRAHLHVVGMLWFMSKT